MAVKLAILKSGEDIIADIHEMVINDEESESESEKEKIVGYIFTKPCVVTLNANEVNGEDQKTIEIKMSPWIPLSKSNKVPVTFDWVITIVDPVDKLKDMYEKDVLNGTGINQVNSISK